MKTRISLPSRWLGSLGAALLTVWGFAAICNAQVNSPVGTWDCQLSGGGHKGIAFITFYNDYTFAGFEMLVPAIKSSDTDGRPGGGTGERGDTDTPSEKVRLVGSGPFAGPWSYDLNGRVIGFYTRDTSFGTASVSFVGTVKTGTSPRLTLKSSTTSGNIVYRGVPQQVLTDVSGSWSGVKQQGKLLFQEFFILSGSTWPNLYIVDGEGPGYGYTNGICMVSIKGKTGFVMSEVAEGGGTNSALRATFGNMRMAKTGLTAKTKGVLRPQTSIKFNASMFAAP